MSAGIKDTSTQTRTDVTAKRRRNFPSSLLFPAFIPLLLYFLYLLSSPPDFDTSMLLPRPDAPKNALIVTAHPDDEAMFFSPTILALTRNGWNVSGLCLSNGNAEGLGDQREKELYASYNLLGVPSSNVEIINDPALQDGMQRAWMPSDAGKYVYRRLDIEPFSVVIKFDKYGISGHINHRAASLACSPVNWPFLITTRKVKVWAVRTPSLLEKYMGPLPAIYHLVHTRIADTEKGREVLRLLRLDRKEGAWRKVEVINGLERWWTGIEAMREHKTQLVWFRWIWLGVGSLQWTNTLIEAW